MKAQLLAHGVGHSYSYGYRLASGIWAKAKAGAQLQVSIWDMGQGQSWGTVTVSARLASETWSKPKLGHSTVSVRLASGIWPELARVQHSSCQILHHTCEAQLQILYALVIIIINISEYSDR